MKHSLDPIQLFSHLPSNKPIIAAVSGGSDSMALLLLASSWAKSTGADLRVVTIDHGLRPEAAAEAAFVAAVCEGLELSHVTLAWEGMKPSSGLPKAARMARYHLMEEFASNIGSNTILVAHQANDQAETIAMRSFRQGDKDGHRSGRGLSGMATRVRLPNGVMLERPLLHLNRDELRAYLKDNTQVWIEDPSNVDTAYERVRVREWLQDDKVVNDICRLGGASAKLRKISSQRVGDFLSRFVRPMMGPYYEIKTPAFDLLPQSDKTLVIQMLVACVGGGEYFVSPDKLNGLMDSDASRRVNVGKVIIEKNKGALCFYREARNLPDLWLEPGEQVLWDGRISIINRSHVALRCHSPAHDDPVADMLVASASVAQLPQGVLKSTLCLETADAQRFFPLLDSNDVPSRVTVTPIVRAVEYFCPEFDFDLLNYVQQTRNPIQPFNQDRFSI